MRNQLTAATTATVITLATAAIAHQGAKGVVKERMDAMGVIAANMKTVGLMIRGSAEFDPEGVRSSMQEIADLAAMLPHKFPAGTDAAPSEAAPAIWAEPNAFNAIFNEMELSSQTVANSADDKTAVASGFQDVAKTCKACHAAYRISRN